MTAKNNFKNLEHLWQLRWRARTDLLWLCNNILNYHDVNEKIHGPIIRHLQQFPLPDIETAQRCDKILPNGKFLYTPWCDPYKTLIGSRRNAIFDPRGWFKTSLNTVAHSTQWLLNFPHLAIGTLFSADKKSQAVLGEIKEHFRSNSRLREIFPDFCPQKRIADWGTMEDFTLPNRAGVLERLGLPPRKEPSMMSQSIEKSQAGYHYDILKLSDIVEENNVSTDGQRNLIKKRFGLLSKLLVMRPDGTDGFLDIEGTFYHLDDLHCMMIDEWQKEDQKGLKHEWNIFVRGVFQRATDNPKYTPAELTLPFKKDKNGKRCPTWPEANPLVKLEEEEKSPHNGGFIFATQKVLDIRSFTGSERPFPSKPQYKKLVEYRKVPIAFKIMTVDLADTTGPKSNPSVITEAAFDRVGRCYVEAIQRGKWGPAETIDRIFETYKRMTPAPAKVVIEDYAYVHGLKPSIDRKSHMNLVFPPFHFVPGDRTKNKVTRIINALQPPFINEEIFFVIADPDYIPTENDRFVIKGVGIEEKLVLERELAECTVQSTGNSDDILDTLAYLFLAKDWFGPELLRGGIIQTPEARNRLQTEQYEKLRREMLFPTSREEHFDPCKIVSGW